MENSPISWQQSLAGAYTSVEELCRDLKIDANVLPLLSHYKAFPLRVPRSFVQLMEVGNPHDPLLRQVLPLKNELHDYPGYTHDPVGDLNAVATAGIIQKYHGRVLIILTGACAIHCRYCFRRNFPYSEIQLSKQKLQQAIDFISKNSEITEVILSGGDPLLINDGMLAQLLQLLDAIPHLKRIRIHSRIPVVLPARITPTLLDILAASNKRLMLVIHANHPNELSAELGAVCRLMVKNGIGLLNQSVLLKDINDEGKILCQLSEQLFDYGILPYYLHLLDHASGTGHFEVADAEALALIDYMRERLPGYLIPKLVREQAGAAYKLPVY